MIFDIGRDFADVLEAMPEGLPRSRILNVLDKAVRRDACFIERHPPPPSGGCYWISGAGTGTRQRGVFRGATSSVALMAMGVTRAQVSQRSYQPAAWRLAVHQ